MHSHQPSHVHRHDIIPVMAASCIPEEANLRWDLRISHGGKVGRSNRPTP
jgi:hypothetical protein